MRIEAVRTDQAPESEREEERNLHLLIMNVSEASCKCAHELGIGLREFYQNRRIGESRLPPASPSPQDSDLLRTVPVLPRSPSGLCTAH